MGDTVFTDWYIGWLFMAWAIGYCGGAMHRGYTQLLEKATQ